MNKEDIEFMSNAIMQSKRTIEHGFHQYSSSIHSSGKYEEEHEGYTEKWLKEEIKNLHTLILSFFEAKKLDYSYEKFRTKFELTINNEDDLLDEGFYEPEGYPELKVLYEFQRHLISHREFSDTTTSDKSISKAVSILENTGHILKFLNKNIEREADVYNPIKWVLGLYFNDTRLKKKKSSFTQKYKGYEPDILIPELKTAIEYKYIKESEKDSVVDNIIDQIKVDSINYTGDYRYTNFIAVIHLESNKLTTHDQIRISWKSKKFPNNWKLIITNS